MAVTAIGRTQINGKKYCFILKKGGSMLPCNTH